MPLGLEGVADFTASVISNYKRGQWTDISTNYQDYVSVRILKEKLVKEKGGDYLKWDVQTGFSNTVRSSGLYDVDVTDVTDTLVQASVPWRKFTGNYSYDVDADDFQGGDEMRIIGYIVLKEHELMNEFAEYLEGATWNGPASDSASDAAAMGITFWVQQDNTQDGAFTGGNPSGFSSGAGGIDSDEYEKWRNWAGGFTAVTETDMIAKAKKAIRYTNFVPPHSYPEAKMGAPASGLYTVHENLEAMERRAETRNDNMGRELARFMDEVVIAGIPVTHVFWLTANTSNRPLYGLQWSYLRPYSKKGKWMEKTGPLRNGLSHKVFSVFFDTWWNWACTDRRRQFVLTSTT